MLKCYIEGRNIVNGLPKQFQIADGAVFTENYNETLDSGTIILPHIKQKIEIEPYDVVVIFSTADSKCKITQRRLCVDTIRCTQTSLDPEIYKYEIGLFSETKLLEGILCPSLAITKLKVSGREPRSVYYYLVQYNNEYGTKTNSNATQGAFGNKFSFGSNINNPNDTVYNRFNAIACPEMQWNQPTLREVIADLMMVDDCIPVIRNNKIDFIDISETKSEITNAQKQGINYITESQSSADYVSEIKMNIQNAVNSSSPTGSYEDIDSANLPKDKTTIVEEIGFRNNETYLLTTENIQVETSFPIYDLLYTEIIFNATGFYYRESDGIDSYFDCEVHLILKSSSKKYILEYGEWQTKDIKYSGFNETQPLSGNYQNTCLYYKRGSRNILNFNAKQSKTFLWIDQQVSVYELIVNGDLAKQYVMDYISRYETGHFHISTWNNVKIVDCRFKVAYEPLCEETFMASKMPMPRNKRQIIDNQTNSYIDVERQGFVEYLKAKRLGNKIKLINARYKTDESDLPTLAEKVNNSIIFRKEISVKDNYINVNYQATDNYVLRDYFTGIKSKLRSWNVVSGEEAFVRADLLKFYINSSIPSVDNENRKIPVYNSLNDYLTHFKYCVVRFYTEDGWKPNSATAPWGADYYMVEITKQKCGNSVLITFKMQDNTFVAKYISSITEQSGGFGQKNAYYTNYFGETIRGEILFYENFDPQNYDSHATLQSEAQAMKPFVVSNRQLSNLVAKIPFEFHKDNKEIQQITIQFEMNEYANDMFLGKK